MRTTDHVWGGNPGGSGASPRTGEEALEAHLRQWLAAVSVAYRERGDLWSPRLGRLAESLAVVRRYTGSGVDPWLRDYAHRQVVRLEEERGRELRRLFRCRVQEILDAGAVPDPEAVIAGRQLTEAGPFARIARLESRIAAANPRRPPLRVTPTKPAG